MLPAQSRVQPQQPFTLPQQSPFHDPHLSQNFASMAMNRANPMLFHPNNTGHRPLEVIGLAPNQQPQSQQQQPQNYPTRLPQQQQHQLQVPQSPQNPNSQPNIFTSPQSDALRSSPSHSSQPGIGNHIPVTQQSQQPPPPQQQQQQQQPPPLPSVRRPMPISFQELRERAQQLQHSIANNENILSQMSTRRAQTSDAEYLSSIQHIQIDTKTKRDLLMKVMQAMTTAARGMYVAYLFPPFYFP